MFSPDGRFVAYVSGEAGREDIYVQSYPEAGAPIPVSTEGGDDPLWNPNGGELFYKHLDTLMVVEVATEPEFTAGKPRPLFEGAYVTGVSGNYDVSPDGERFVMIRREEGSVPTELHVVVNWFRELNRVLPWED